MLKTAYSEWDNKTHWGIVNTVKDESFEQACAFSKQENALFFEIVEELLENNGVISYATAHSLGNQSSLTTTAAAMAVQKMERLRWFSHVKGSDGEVRLCPGPRALLELPRVRTWALSRSQSGVRTQATEAGDAGITSVERGNRARSRIVQTDNDDNDDGNNIKSDNVNIVHNEEEDVIEPINSHEQRHSRSRRVERASQSQRVNQKRRHSVSAAREEAGGADMMDVDEDEITPSSRRPPRTARSGSIGASQGSQRPRHRMSQDISPVPSARSRRSGRRSGENR